MKRLQSVLAGRRAAILVHVLLLGLLVVFLGQTYTRAHRSYGYDFASYLASASALVDGGDPYHTASRFPYIYPLFLAFVLVPLTKVPYDVAVALWFAAGAASAWLAARLVTRLARPPEERA